MNTYQHFAIPQLMASLICDRIMIESDCSYPSITDQPISRMPRKSDRRQGLDSWLAMQWATLENNRRQAC